MNRDWLKRIAAFALVGVLTLTGIALLTPTQNASAIESYTDFTEIYDEVSPSVVAINVARPVGFDSSTDPDEAPIIGGGSGFVIDKQGHIVTNNHVIEGASRIEVNFLDGTIARAEIVGTDPDSDLAVIKVSTDDVPPERLKPVRFGDSSDLRIGETVLAIGSPFGQRWTLTAGIISALDRTIQGLTQFSIGGVIQTDAAINPGNSGGPLLNVAGEVIGVNSQIRSSTRSSSGIGFAVPSNLTQRVARELIERGSVDYSYIGISGGNVNLDIIEDLNLFNNLRGVVVSSVAPGGPADLAGLNAADASTSSSGQVTFRSADIITHINGEPLSGIEALISYLARETRPGDTVTLTVLRDGREIQLDVTLQSRPSNLR